MTKRHVLVWDDYLMRLLVSSTRTVLDSCYVAGNKKYVEVTGKDKHKLPNDKYMTKEYRWMRSIHWESFVLAADATNCVNSREAIWGRSFLTSPTATDPRFLHTLISDPSSCWEVTLALGKIVFHKALVCKKKSMT